MKTFLVTCGKTEGEFPDARWIIEHRTMDGETREEAINSAVKLGLSVVNVEELNKPFDGLKTFKVTFAHSCVASYTFKHGYSICEETSFAKCLEWAENKYRGNLRAIELIGPASIL